MPDLFTHLVAARVPGVFVRDRRIQALLVIGTFMPDIAFKGLYLVLQTRQSFAIASHSILGVVLISYLLCLFLEESIRRPGFVALTAGGLIHVLVDLMKENSGGRAVLLFLPFSTASPDIGWIEPESVALLIPIDAAILAAALFLERRFIRVRQ
jgi:membrane-bound metal-dependent hydrolase YbcI (DUF457 family)